MNRIVAILTIVTVLLGFASCTKYENGPSVSLKSPKSRAVGEWHLTDLLVNDKHEQTLFDKESSAVLTLEKDGTYTYTIPNIRATVEKSGLWSFGEDKTELLLIQLDSINGDSERTYKITRLSKTEMWLVNGSEEYAGFDDLIERHFEKKQE